MSVTINKVNTINKMSRIDGTGKKWIPDLMVYHIADGFDTAVAWMQNPLSATSSNFFIAKTGKVTELVPVNMASYTQGLLIGTTRTPNPAQSKSAIVKSRPSTNPNCYCISIEYEGFYGDFYSGGSLKAKGCKGAITEDQVQATVGLMEYINQEMDKYYGSKYRIKLDREHNIGHYEINPINRAHCPGELFPFDKIIKGYNDKYGTSASVPTVTNESQVSNVIKLENEPLYSSSTTRAVSRRVTGTYYRYDDGEYNNRIRITTSASYVNKTPAGNYVTGYIQQKDDNANVALGPGSKITLDNDALYASSTIATKARSISGTFYIYDGKLFSNRYRICRNQSDVNKATAQVVIGYVNKSDI